MTLNSEEESAVRQMIQDLDAAHAIPGWSARMDAQIALIERDPVIYLVAARRLARKEERGGW